MANVVDGWYFDYHDRCQEIVENGLRATIEDVAFLPPHDGWELLALIIEVGDDQLLRPPDLRGFTLHVSIIFKHEITRELAEAVERLKVQWRGAAVTFNVDRIGRGGTVIFSETDPLRRDPDFQALHEAGFYHYKEPHVSL